VLERPDIPLHTNGLENDIRCQVTKRMIAGGTRSEIGRDCRDAYEDLRQARHLWQYLGARLAVPGADNVPPASRPRRKDLAEPHHAPAEFRPRRSQRVSRASSSRKDLASASSRSHSAKACLTNIRKATALARRRPQVICSWPERITKWLRLGIAKRQHRSGILPLLQIRHCQRNQLPPAPSEFTKQQGRWEALCHNWRPRLRTPPETCRFLCARACAGTGFYRTHVITRTIVLKSTPPGARDIVAECLTVAQSAGS